MTQATGRRGGSAGSGGGGFWRGFVLAPGSMVASATSRFGATSLLFLCVVVVVNDGVDRQRPPTPAMGDEGRADGWGTKRGDAEYHGVFFPPSASEPTSKSPTLLPPL